MNLQMKKYQMHLNIGNNNEKKVRTSSTYISGVGEALKMPTPTKNKKKYNRKKKHKNKNDE